MVHRDAFRNKLRLLGYTYKTRQKRTELWRKVGGQHRVFFPLCDYLEDAYVMNVLRQAGCTQAEAESFLASAKS